MVSAVVCIRTLHVHSHLIGPGFLFGARHSTMGATQCCQTSDKHVPEQIQKPAGPGRNKGSTAEPPSTPPAAKASSALQSGLAKFRKGLKGAVEDVSEFRKFLKVKFASPDKAFTAYAKGAVHIARDGFISHSKEIGFMGNAERVFDTICDGDGVLTRATWKEKLGKSGSTVLKAGDAPKQDFMTVVREAVQREKAAQAAAEAAKEDAEDGDQPAKGSRRPSKAGTPTAKQASSNSRKGAPSPTRGSGGSRRPSQANAGDSSAAQSASPRRRASCPAGNRSQEGKRAPRTEPDELRRVKSDPDIGTTCNDDDDSSKLKAKAKLQAALGGRR